MQSFGDMQTMASNVFSAYASVAASIMLYRSMVNDIIPEPIKFYVISVYNRLLNYFFTPLSTEITMVVEENSGMARNHIYVAAEVYLHTKINPNTKRFRVSKYSKKKNITLSMEKEEKVIDTYNGIRLKWQFVSKAIENQRDDEKRYFELTFNEQHKETVLNDYLPFVLEKAKEIKEKDRDVKLYTTDCPWTNDDDDGRRGRGDWGYVHLDHPVTFDKLAMDPGLKNQIIEDLDMFMRRREYYKRVGKAWKRGYLLYGPPGTGKSSLIAAIANYLKFDIYDLELNSFYSNSELKRTLLSTTNRSIIMIEDIDCNAPMLNRDAGYEYRNSNEKLTLSGLLNFMDGLWSNSGDERIIIFTTNHKEKIDPALLRPGRMDMHIHMSYCTDEGFDVLAYNYLGIRDHPRLFLEIKTLMQEVKVTPAEIAEQLMRNENAERALEGVMDLLKRKKAEANEEKNTVEETIKGDEVREEKKTETKIKEIVKS